MIEIKSESEDSRVDKNEFADVGYSLFLVIGAVLLIYLSGSRIFLLAGVEGTLTLVRCVAHRFLRG